MKLHSNKDINYYYKYMILSLIGLIIFGIVKNGFLLFRETSNYYIIFKPTIYLFINLILGTCLDIIFNKKLFNKYTFSLLLLYMIISINTPLWLFILGDIILIVLLKFDKGILNKIALTKILNVLVLILLHKHDYKNFMEMSGKYVFNFFDMFFKYQVGGICTGSLILVLILLIVLLFNILYKKKISLISITSYVLVILLLIVYYKDNSELLLLINSTALFELIIISNLNLYSPYTNKGQIIYGVLVGTGSALLCRFLWCYDAVAIMTLLLSPSRLLFDNFFAFDTK